MRRGLTAVATVIVLALAAGDAHAARTWEPAEAARTADGVGMRAPHTTFTSTGDLVAAWSRRRPSNGWIPGDWGLDGTPLRVAVRPAGAGGFGEAQTLDPAAWPLTSVAADRSGGAMVAWLSSDQQVKASWRGPGGVFTPAQTIADGTSVDVATNGRGDAALVFRGADNGPWLAFRPAGGSFGPPTRLAPTGTVSGRAFPDVGLADDGRAVAVWQDDSSQATLIARAVVRSPDGSLGAPQWLSRTGWHGQSPQVAVGRDGHAMATWTEGVAAHSSGPVMTARLSGGCCFAPPAAAGMTTIWFGATIAPVEGAGALVSAFSLDRDLATQSTHPHGPTIVGADMASGGMTRPVRLEPGVWDGDKMASNARGETVAAIGYTTLDVSRRSPGGGFSVPAGAWCGRGPQVDSVAVSPTGDAAVFFTPWESGQPAESALMIEDRETVQPGADCRPVKQRTRKPGRAALALQARMPRGGRLWRGRWLEVRVFCGRACRIGTGGKVKVAGRRKRLALTSVVTRRTGAGSTTVRVGLTRRDARVVRRALRRHRAVRARVRVAATGGDSGRELVFHVRIRR